MRTITITTSRPRLDIQSTPAKLDITNKRMRPQVKTTPASMEIKRQAPKFNVDWPSYWDQVGRKSPEALRIDVGNYAFSMASEAVATISSDGDSVMRIENYNSGAGTLAQIAGNNMEASIPQVNVGSMPQTAPKISWDPGYMHIDWEIGNVAIEWDGDFMPDFSVTPHSVEIRMAGYPEVKISLNEEALAGDLGRTVNNVI